MYVVRRRENIMNYIMCLVCGRGMLIQCVVCEEVLKGV